MAETKYQEIQVFWLQVDASPNKHLWIAFCRFTSNLLEIVNKSAKNITNNLKAKHEIKLAEWHKQKTQLTNPPKFNASFWLVKTKVSRVFSIFLILAILVETHGFRLMDNKLNKNGCAWLVLDNVNLGHLKKIDFFFEKHLCFICAPAHYLKLTTMNCLIENV